MIRIVRDFVPTPRFFALCDIPTCCCFAQMPVPPFDVSATQNPTVLFIQAIEKEGWSVSLLQHLCPDHMKIVRAAAEKERKLIIPANGPLPVFKH